MAKYLVLVIIHFIIPITLGTFIYLLFRPESLLVFQWLQTLKLLDFVMIAREIIDVYDKLPNWIVYSLPNGLWSYSFMFFMALIWKDSKNYIKWFFILLVVGISLGSEFGQLTGLIPGTFCVVDVFFYSGGLAGGYLMGNTIKNKRGVNKYDKAKDFTFTNLRCSFCIFSSRKH